MHCDLCKPLTVADLRDNDIYHHSTLAALRNSAESGCVMCNLFWTCLVTSESYNVDAFKTHLEGRFWGDEDKQALDGLTDTAVRLRAELHDNGAETMEEHFQSKIHVYSGRRHGPEINTELGSAVYGWVGLYARPDSPSARWVSGREVPPDPSSDSCFHFVTSWIETCDQHHGCSPGKETLLPKRVVDVRSSDQNAEPILRETRGVYGRYAALSYCWGEGQKYITTKETIAQFRSGIAMSKLSKTIIDAI
ncbi:hypothetical protein EV356DRAFT_509099 [Viridothelium virens]|uniref:Heterokaryon incompatibility domain-containing protein n=1 Tax=Viridothelium virens TaxID=1048519 RepID=A0A6A6GX80_VIRVR|nr:hypothetical protein EV356DRAFT_509099 [Viridothelium virens]